MFTSKKALENEALRAVITENQRLFDLKSYYQESSGDFNCILLFVLYERNRSDSFYARVFSVTEQSYCLLDDREECYKRIRDRFLTSKLRFFEFMYEHLRTAFRELVEQYRATFVNARVNLADGFDEKFAWAFGYCMTRRMQFEELHNETYIVPLMDFVNHGPDQCRFQLQRSADARDVADSVASGRVAAEGAGDEEAENRLQYLRLKRAFLAPDESAFLDAVRADDLDARQLQRLYDLVDCVNYRLLRHDAELEIWNFNYIENEDVIQEETMNQAELEQYYRRKRIEQEENNLMAESAVFVREKFAPQTALRGGAEQPREAPKDSTKAQVDDAYLKSYYDDDDEE